VKAEEPSPQEAEAEQEEGNVGENGDGAGAQKGDDKAKGGQLMQKEKKASGRIGVSDFMFVARAANAWVLGTVALVLTFLTPVFRYGINFLLSWWTDSMVANVASDGGPFDDLVPPVTYAASCVAFVIVTFCSSIACVMYFRRASRTLHEQMVATTIRQPMSWFDTTPIGRILNRFGVDVMMMDIYLPMMFQFWLMMLVGIMITFIAAGITALPALLMSFIIAFAAVKLYNYYGAIQLEITRIAMIAMSPLLAQQSGFLAALDTIRCFGRVDIFLKRFETVQDNFCRSYYWMYTSERAVQIIFTTIIVSLFFGATAALILTLSIYETPLSFMVSKGRAGVVLAYLSAVGYHIPMCLFITTKVETMMGAAQRIAEYATQATEDTPHLARLEAPPASWPQQGTLHLQKLEMRYRPDLPLVLKGIEIEVKPGERVGIVGRTGSGKSSLLLSCFRMIECAGGSVVIDGQDIAKVPVETLRGRLGVIPQDAWLFSGSLRSNLDYAGLRTDEEIWEMLRVAHVADQVKSWPEGLDLEIQEKGENLSQGTSQLLCLARVLLKKPQLLFMDEATASVDSETDLFVQKAIREPGALLPDCSVVTIAHRLHTVIDYDRIVVLDKGIIVESGAPSTLANSGGFLSRLVDDCGEAGASELRRRAQRAR